ncbi:autotransporter outer membrane beta-barrel domain-containing protein [Pseudomonas sp. NFX1]|uniref:autotransporter outer membrane beta-barrel domain-containing protein n=1 Tax=Pseudomonas sp. NFX1 TaxID=2201355 RepID=UPI003DA78B0A
MKFFTGSRHPLAQAVSSGLLVSIALFGQPAQALTTVRGELNIDDQVAVDNYRVTSGSVLNAVGASTQQIDLSPEASVNLDKTAVVATGADGIRASAGGKVTLGNQSSVVSDRFGIRLLRTGTEGASAVVTGSRVEGAIAGAGVAAGSRLDLHDSELIGSGARGVAAQLFGDATLDVRGSELSGTANGIAAYGDPTLAGAANVLLTDTQVQASEGAAIIVGDPYLGPSSANIVVSGKSSLSGGNGAMLEVVGSSSANLLVDSSELHGDVRVEAGSVADVRLQNGASLTGRLENVSSLGLDSDARWNMVEDSSVAKLAMAGGSVRFGEKDHYQRLTLGELSGSGTFVMDADFSTGQTDFLEITGRAEGQHVLAVGSSGAEPDAANSLQLVHAAAGDAQFSLRDGPVDLGAFSYDLVQRGNDWFLDGASKVISPGTASVLALYSAAPTVWYGELSSLRSRMGELRLDERKSGGWIRAYGNKYNVAQASGLGYQQVQHGFSLGADAPLPVGDGQWLLGVMAGSSRSDLSLEGGASGEVDSYYAGLYATWLDARSGYYFDGVAKFNRFDNASKVGLSDGTSTKGDYKQNGVGVSAEFGRHVELDGGVFIEPFTQWSLVQFQGKDYRLDNGLQASTGDSHSLLGKAGATVGRNIDLGAGRVLQPYLRLAYVHEFGNDNDVKVNGNRFDSDLSGSRGELGAGVAVSLIDGLQMHADFEYSNGRKIEQPWGMNVGLRYNW